MKLPIRNKTSESILLFIEVTCEEYEIPAGGEALVTLEDGQPHSIDLHDRQITVWNEGYERALVDISAPQPER